MPGIGSNGSSISPRPLDDMGSTKAIVDDVVQKAKDPLDSNFSDQTWLRKASDALHIHKSQRQFSEDLTRAYFFVLDNEIQLALRTKNTRSSEDYLKRMDQLLGETTHTSNDPKNSYSQFLAFATATLYYRAASHLLLLVKKAMTVDQQRLRLSVVCTSVAMSTHLRQKQDMTYLEAMRSMDLLEMNALLAGLGSVSGVGSEVPRLLVDKETPKLLYKSLFSNATLGAQLGNSLLGSQSLSASYPVTLENPMIYLSNIGSLLTQKLFIDRFVWLLANDHRFLNDRLESIDNFFPTLTLSTDNLDSTTPDALCLLDLKVFLVTCVQWSQERVKLLNRRSLFGPDIISPPAISEALVNDAERRWWLAAVWLTRPQIVAPPASVGSLNDFRINLHQGLETLRLVDCKGADIPLIDAVADWLLRASQTEDQWSDRYLAYAARYFKVIVDRLENNQRVTTAQQGMFAIQLAAPGGKEATEMENRARFHLAEHEFRLGRNENALEIVDKLDSVRSKQLQFEIYTAMARATNDRTKREALTAKANSLRPGTAAAAQDTTATSNTEFNSSALSDMSVCSPSIFHTPRSQAGSRQPRNGDERASQAVLDMSDQMSSLRVAHLDETVKALMEQNKQLMDQNKELMAENAKIQRTYMEEARRQERDLHERHAKELERVHAEERQRAKEEHDRIMEQMREFVRISAEARALNAAAAADVRPPPPASAPLHSSHYSYSPMLHQPMAPSQPHGVFWPTPPAMPYGASYQQSPGMMMSQQQPGLNQTTPQQQSHLQQMMTTPQQHQPLQHQPLQHQPQHQPLQHQQQPQHQPLQHQQQPQHQQQQHQQIVPQQPAATVTTAATTTSRQTISFASPVVSSAGPATNMSRNTLTSGTNLFANIASPTASNVSPSVPTSHRTRGESEASGGEPEHYEPETHFEPVIPLPDLVEVTTGEEDEEALFSQRAKLFRYVTESNEWKERGTGELKLLRDPDSKKVRLVMRRDQVHKVCANHRLNSQMKLTPMQKSDRAWVWSCQDFSEGVLTDETFAAKFKDPDTANQFRDAFQSAVASSSASPSAPQRASATTSASSASAMTATTTTSTTTTTKTATTTAAAGGFSLFGVKSTTSTAGGGGFQFSAPTTTTTAATTTATSSPLADMLKKSDKPSPAATTSQSAVVAPLAKTEPAKAGFGDKFKPQPGSWECQGCYIRNAADLTKCPCCGTGKDGSAPQPTIGGALSFGGQKPTAAVAPSSAAGFSFGLGASPAPSASATPTSTPAAPAAAAAVTTSAPAASTTFTFGQAKPAVKKEESTTTPASTSSLFGQFSFTPADKDKKKAEAAQPAALFGQSTGGGGLSFGTLAASSAGAAGGSPFQAKASDAAQSGTKLFGNVQSPKPNSSPVTRTRGESETSGGEPENYEPEVHFEPVVPLPDLVEVTTGEENEESLFSQRAKLFRYIAESNEWKERGVGELKILRDTEAKTVRLVMRRDQVHKVCANHRLNSQMKLTPMQKSDRAWVWSCQDFSEGVLTDETFAAKFKDPDTASQFRDAFQAAVGGKESTTPAKSTSDTAKAATTTTTTAATTTPKGAAVFGSGGGLFGASATTTASPASTTTTSQSTTFGSSGSASKLPTSTTTAAAVTPSFSNFSFGSSAATTPSTSAPTNTPAAPSVTVAPTGAANPKFTFGGVSFGQPKPAAKKDESTPSSTSSVFGQFSFGSTDKKGESTQPTSVFGGGSSGGGGGGGLSFASLASSADSTPAFQSKGTGFAGTGAKLFANFQSSGSATTDASPAGHRTRGESETSGGEPENYEPEAHFEPVIPLPDLVEVTTGEENEETLFSERSKLFRYITESNEWKERGVGELKILRDLDSKKVRLVMRREQVHKVCANHYLTPQTKLTPMQKSDRAWVWSCQDFSEGFLTDEMFAAKFKNPEVADKFRAAFESAVGGESSASSKAGGDNQKTATPTLKGAAVFGNGGRLFGTSATTSSPTSAAPTSTPGGASPSAASFSFKLGASTEQKTPVSPSPVNFSFSLPKDTAPAASKAGAVKKDDPSYQLPADFYDYEHKEPCPGCMGCASEEDQETALRTLDYMANSPYVDDEEEYEEEEEEGGDESEELEPVWESRATLTISDPDASPLKAKAEGQTVQGYARIIPDGDMEYAYRVEFTTEEGDKVMSHPIVLEDSLTATEKKTSPWYADWTAYDFANDLPLRRSFRLSFNNAKARDDFVKTYQTGVEIAKENSVHRYNPDEQDLDQQDDNDHRFMFEALKKSIPKDEHADY